MKRVNTLDIIKMNDLYLKYKNKAEVARQTGFSASTVAKYLIPNYVPTSEIKVIAFDSVVSKKVNKNRFELTSWNSLLDLTEEEKKEIEELRKEVSL